MIRGKRFDRHTFGEDIQHSLWKVLGTPRMLSIDATTIPALMVHAPRSKNIIKMKPNGSRTQKQIIKMKPKGSRNQKSNYKKVWANQQKCHQGW